ncbi:hypothetical protein DFJ77DRAFT_146913 [Powellomyces hirtus]|nr:hypothetical protein DFJ77DRAFT_146913 [Powellomyces hirtus]
MKPVVRNPTTDHPLAFTHDYIEYTHPGVRSWRRRCSSEPVKPKSANSLIPRTAHDLAEASGTTAAGSPKIKHIVKPGDTLEKIALLYGVSVAEIKRTNRIWNADEIFLRKAVEISSAAKSEGSDDSKPSRHETPGPIIDSSVSNPPSSQPSHSGTSSASVTQLLNQIDADVKSALFKLPMAIPPPPSTVPTGKIPLYPPAASPRSHRVGQSPLTSPKHTPRGTRHIRVRPNGFPATLVDPEPSAPAAETSDKGKGLPVRDSRPMKEETRKESDDEETEMQSLVDRIPCTADGTSDHYSAWA